MAEPISTALAIIVPVGHISSYDAGIHTDSYLRRLGDLSGQSGADHD